MDAQDVISFIPQLRGRPVTVVPLDGGLTNRNYRLDTDGESFVLRVAGRDTALLGIDRACEVASSRIAAALGVGPEVVAYLPDHGAMLRRFVPGRTLTAEDVQRPAVLRRLVSALRRYHDGPPAAGRFSPFAIVRNYHALARDRRVTFPDNFGRALERLAVIEQQSKSEDPPCPCHNDLLAANLIDDGATVRIIDWEYSGMGDLFFDLGNLAANNEFDTANERDLIEAYFGEVRPDHLRRLRLMRQASDMREAMWGFLQSALSTLGVDYLAYGRKHLERFLQRET